MEKFFDRVNHDVLMAKVAVRIRDQRIVKLIRRILTAGAVTLAGFEPATEGTPQGSPLSPIMFKIYNDKRRNRMKGKLIFSIIGVALFVFAICRTAPSAPHLKEYSNKQYGISFTIPDGIDLYTTDNPGPLVAQISPSAPFIFVNPAFTEENINVKMTDNVSESDLNDFKKGIDNNPNVAVPQYKRLSVSFIKIGKQKNKTAVEHVFIMKGNILGKLRQVTFSHKGRGFIFTCATAVDRFDKANQSFFNPLFASMTFN